MRRVRERQQNAKKKLMHFDGYVCISRETDIYMRYNAETTSEG
jgi:hypothetical protein